MKIQRTLVLAGVIMLAGLALATAQSTPQLIKIQGYLSDKSGGTPVPANGIFNMIFDLYDAEVLGNFVATSSTIPVGVTNGLYEAKVQFPSSAFNGSVRWVEITVETETLTPRIQLGAVPFAYQAEQLDGMEGADLEESAEIDADVAAHAGLPDAHREHATLEESAEIATKVSKTGDTMTGGLTLSPISGNALVTTSGNVGIGTTTPVTKLDVAGDAKINTDLTVVGSMSVGSQFTFQGGSPASDRILTSDASGLATWRDPVSLVSGITGRPLHSISTIDTDRVGEHTSIAIGVNGLAVISYFDARNGDLKVAHCGDVGCTTATSTTLDSGNTVGQYTSIAIGMDGFPVISYIGIGPELWVAHCEDTGCIASTITEMEGGDPESTSIAIGVDGFPVISYFDSNNLKVAHCLNVGCTSRTFSYVSVLGVKVDGADASLAIGADGLPIISFSESTAAGDELVVVQCVDTSCSSFNSPKRVDEIGNRTSIAIGSDGFPIISYFNGTSLKVAHCEDPTCILTTTNTLDTLGETTDTSITIRPDGIPVISYFDPFLGSLKIAHCNNIDCTGVTLTTIVLDSGGVGEHSSFTIGMDGFPVISYFDSINLALKVAHCSNPFCVPWHRPR